MTELHGFRLEILILSLLLLKHIEEALSKYLLDGWMNGSMNL